VSVIVREIDGESESENKMERARSSERHGECQIKRVTGEKKGKISTENGSMKMNEEEAEEKTRSRMKLILKKEIS